MQALIGSGRRIAAICTGAGADLIKLLWGTPGASEYLVAAYLTYTEDATERFIGGSCVKMVSAEVAYRLAVSAEERSGDIGIGLTASVAGLREHRGAHEFYACAAGPRGMRFCHTILKKGTGLGVRWMDDRACTDAIELILKQELLTKRVLFPGAFNPLHWGHELVAEKVSEMTGLPVEYYVCPHPPHKPSLTYDDMATRAHHAMLFGGSPLYLDKARENPGAPFIIGVDSLVRMLDPKWGLDPVKMLQEFRELGTKFYVPGRVLEGREIRLKDVNVLGYDGLFVEVPVCTSVSSTEIRNERESTASAS